MKRSPEIHLKTVQYCAANSTIIVFHTNICITEQIHQLWVFCFILYRHR